MKIRRSARSILASLLLLSVFTSITVWHNKAPGNLSEQEKQHLLQQLSLKNPNLALFIDQKRLMDDPHGFYAIGVGNENVLPLNVFRASYSDPLAAWSMKAQLPNPGSHKIELTRYRSIEDFLIILDNTEQYIPGRLATLEFSRYHAVSEPSLAISLRLLLSITIGAIGLLLVRYFNRL